MPGFGDSIVGPIVVLETESMRDAVYSVVIQLSSEKEASRFYSAFNGRYFSDGAREDSRYC